MATATSERLMTAEEFLQVPDDGMERMLIRGRLWEKPMTKRNRWHSRVEAQIVYLLKAWLETRSRPRGEILSGEAGFRIRRNPDTAVGIDVAYVSHEVAVREPDDTRLVDGPPTLAVEILSPNDKQEELTAKLDSYLEAGVPLVWVVEPHFQTVTVYTPGGRPEMYSGEDVLSGEPHLPGFRATVGRIFAR